MNKCYPDEKLTENISKRDKYLIKDIIVQLAYTQFLKQQEAVEEE